MDKIVYFCKDFPEQVDTGPAVFGAVTVAYGLVDAREYYLAESTALVTVLGESGSEQIPKGDLHGDPMECMNQVTDSRLLANK